MCHETLISVAAVGLYAAVSSCPSKDWLLLLFSLSVSCPPSLHHHSFLHFQSRLHGDIPELYAYLLWALTELCFGLKRNPTVREAFFPLSFDSSLQRPIISKGPRRRRRRETSLRKTKRERQRNKYLKEKERKRKKNTHLPDGSYPGETKKGRDERKKTKKIK